MLKDKDNDLSSNNIDDNLNHKPDIKPRCNKSSDFNNNYIVPSNNLFTK